MCLIRATSLGETLRLAQPCLDDLWLGHDERRFVHERFLGAWVVPAECQAHDILLCVQEDDLWRSVPLVAVQGAVTAVLVRLGYAEPMLRLCALLCVFMIGCGDVGEETTPPDEQRDACEGDMVDASCCGPGTLHVAGVCQAAGVPPENCAEGFEPDGAMGCEPVLPVTPCATGEMAIPGDSLCRPVAPCGAGSWGDIPVDSATTEHVLAGATGVPDGSAASPWPTIQQAVNAATPGAIVAIGAGSYSETVSVSNKPVILWGKCPAEAELVGGAQAALTVTGSAGTEVRDLAVRGASWGIAASGGALLFDRLWIHDVSENGLIVTDDSGETNAELSRSLVERAQNTVVELLGANLIVRDSEVRDGMDLDGPGGIAGRGIRAWPGSLGAVANLTVEGSLVRNNVIAGVAVVGSIARVDATAIINTLPAAEGDSGKGIGAFMLDGVAPQVTITRSLVASSHGMGIHGIGADLTIEDTLVRDTLPRPLDQQLGRGVEVDDDLDMLRRSTLMLTRSKLERNHNISLLVMASDATIESLLIRDTIATAATGDGGIGIDVQLGLESQQPSTATIRGTLVERSKEFGILVVSSSTVIEQTHVRETGAIPTGLFGDGVAFSSPTTPAEGQVNGLLSEQNARGGLTSFGAQVSLAHASLTCNLLDLVGSDHNAFTPQLVDGGDNLCGCEADGTACKMATTSVEIPEAPVE
jgi:hypothetical protein